MALELAHQGLVMEVPHSDVTVATAAEAYLKTNNIIRDVCWFSWTLILQSGGIP